jgi:hypothetical protein
MLHAVSTIVLVVLAVGIYFRRQRDLHIKLMTSAFVLDLGLVLYIELTRKAVATVASGSRPLVWTHAAISMTVLFLYVVQIVLGSRLLLARPALAGGTGAASFADAGHSRTLHRNLGIVFVVFRVLNYVTAFLL